MSITNNNNMQTQTSSALQNAIMEARGKDHPPMLAPGNYVQWKSRIKRYINTKPNHKLIHFCLKNPPCQYKFLTIDANVTRVTPGNEDIQKWINAEAEAVQIILTGIDNDIYSIADACPNAMKMWKTIKSLKQGESINVQDLETNLYWEFGKFTLQEAKPRHNVSYHKLYDILKQHQNEVNEIRAERLARTTNPLTLVAQQQLVYHSQPNLTHYTQSSSTRSQDATRNRGKAIANSLQPTYDLEPEVVDNDDASSKEKEIDKLMALILMSFKKIYKPTNSNLRTSSNIMNLNVDNTPRSSRGTRYDRQTRQYENQRAVNVNVARENVGTQVVQQNGIQCYNYKEFRDLAKECQKPKRAWDSAYHKEKMLLCKQEEVGIQLSAEQVDWRDDTDDEPEDQELEAHYMFMAKIQEVTPDGADNSGPIFDAEPLQKVHNGGDDYNVFANERQHHEQPESVYDTYLIEQERELLASLIEQMKIEIDANKQNNKALESSNKSLKEANTYLQSELMRYQDTDFVKNAREKCATAYGLLKEHKVKSEKSSSSYTEKILSLNKKVLEMENELSAHKRTISTISFQKDEQENVFKTHEDKEIKKFICLENQVKVLNDIVYKRGQLVQTMIMLNQNCKTSFVKPEYLKKAQSANPHLYDIGCYNDNLALMLAPESDEMIRLAQESRSKLSDIIKPFDNKNLNNLYDLFVPRSEKLAEQKTENVNNKSFNELSKRFSELEQHSINLELALQQSHEQIKHDKVWKQKESSSFRELNYKFFEIQDLKAQLQDKNIAINFTSKENVVQKNTNVIAPGMYKMNTRIIQPRTPQLPQDIRKTNKRVSFSTRVILTTSISRPQLKSNRLEDRVLHNNSQGKKHEVEDHCRIFKTKKPIVVPISNREPKRKENQSVATPHKKIVASEPTIKKPRSTFRKLYEHVSKTCNWWYPKLTPPRYKRKPNSKTGNVTSNLVEIILFIVNFGCSKHMTGNLKLLSNFLEKFLRMVKFGNDQFAPILGYGDLVQGNITIKRKSTCYVRDLKGNDLLIGSRGTNLYSITLQDTTSPNPIFLMAKASSSQAWLWHRRLLHLNFDTINLLLKNDIVIGLPKLKFIKDHLCSSCELGKAKRKSFKTKTTPSSKRWLQLLHMDLCGPMRVECINDETPEVLIDFLRLIQRGLHAQVRTVRNDKDTEFLNNALHEYYFQEGIEDQTFVARTPEQNDVLERRNCTLVEATRTMLIVAKVPFLSPASQSQVNVPQAVESVTTSLIELDMLFNPMFDEYFNGATTVVSKSSVVPTTDASDKRHQQNTASSSSTTIAVDLSPLII
ncbi:retrovirus-related pol polyprotein from transposon TNT 1-94 [Tanacetum coccineum]|uniref:Retrovirus-related pol polyprotein from transposon TNT 1-94 n=1 Tax=Tanacetum coccineum TaxID=301880 RepID=A0ABQ5GH84_9ASTR